MKECNHVDCRFISCFEIDGKYDVLLALCQLSKSSYIVSSCAGAYIQCELYMHVSLENKTKM